MVHVSHSMGHKCSNMTINTTTLQILLTVQTRTKQQSTLVHRRHLQLICCKLHLLFLPLVVHDLKPYRVSQRQPPAPVRIRLSRVAQKRTMTTKSMEENV